MTEQLIQAWDSLLPTQLFGSIILAVAIGIIVYHIGMHTSSQMVINIIAVGSFLTIGISCLAVSITTLLIALGAFLAIVYVTWKRSSNNDDDQNDRGGGGGGSGGRFDPEDYPGLVPVPIPVRNDEHSFKKY